MSLNTSAMQYVFFSRYVVKELLTTEEGYVEQLDSVVKVVY